MRLLVLLGLVVLAVWLIRRALRGPAAPRAPGGPAEEGGALVPCARCGVNVPRSEAREAQGALYCSEEHARLGHG